jgi:drug/metabolite transporter (DMT)-like permease
MTERATRAEWLIFLALGFMWGSSYLFIKLAVDDFGTFTLVALRLIVGGLFLWIALRIIGAPIPRERIVYGHLLVMAVINIVIPFALITWAERTVDSSLAAILTSPVPPSPSSSRPSSCAMSRCASTGSRDCWSGSWA